MRTLVIAIGLLALALPASAQFEIWEYIPPTPGGARQFDVPWPDDDVGQWHQLHPAALACTYGTQTDHDDQDNDGLVDECENVEIDGVWKHIEWAGPTIYLWRPDTRESIIVEPIAGPERQNEYHVISPPGAFCSIIDLPGPILQVCDTIIVLEGEFAGEWHVEEIRDNIHTNGGSPVEQSTWSRVKEFFRGLFD